MDRMQIRQPKKRYTSRKDIIDSCNLGRPKTTGTRRCDILENPDNPRQRCREKSKSQISEQERFELASAYLTGKR